MIAVRDGEMASPIIQSLSPLKPQVLIGKNFPSFSKLVNEAVLNAKEEIVIFCSHKTRPTPKDIYKILELLKEGYGVVGLYRFGCFGFLKELFRRVGFFDERFVGGWYEDDDFCVRLKEANIAYYEDESVEYHIANSTWDHSKTYQVFTSKWKKCGYNLIRKMPELTYDYDIGTNNKLKDIPTNKLFLPWEKSVVKSKSMSIVDKYRNFQVVKLNDNDNQYCGINPDDEIYKITFELKNLLQWFKISL